MKILKQIYFIIFIIFSILFSNFIASKINISLEFNSIVGEYSKNDYHPINDFLKFIVYIFLPLIAFITAKFYLDNKVFYNFFSNLNLKTKIYSFDLYIYIYFLTIIFLIIIELLSVQFPLNMIDFFHEGQKLSAAYKSKIDSSLWSGSYVVVGIIYEILNTKLAWQITGQETIGSVRFLDLMYIFITKILLVVLAFQITKFINLSNNLKNFFFLIFSILLTQQIDYNIFSSDTISSREIPVILVLIFFFKSVTFSRLYLPLISFIIITSFFWSIDRALVLTLFSFFIYLYLLFNKKYLNISILLFSKFFFIFIFILFFDNEFNYFLLNTLNVFKEHTYVNGLIHPDLFTNEKNSFRATKNIIAIILSLIISVNLFFHNQSKFNSNLRMILISLSAMSFLSYLYSIGRSDGPHLKQSFGFLYVFFSLYILHFILSKADRYLKFKNNTNIFLMISLFVIIIFHIKAFNFSNIINFNERFKNFVSYSDDKFIDSKDNIFIKRSYRLFKNEKCIQLLTNDAALHYLIKKKHCSKYYFTYTIGSDFNQKKFISEIHNTNYIILGGKTDNWSLSIEEKYPIIFDYFTSNFSLYESFSDRQIFIRN